MKIEVLDVLLNSIDKVKKFTDLTYTFESDVDVVQGRYTIDGKSIMGVFSLSLVEPVTVEIESDNEEEINKFLDMMEEFRIND